MPPWRGLVGAERIYIGAMIDVAAYLIMMASQ